MQMNSFPTCIFDLITPFLPAFSIRHYSFMYNIHATCTVRGRNHQLHMIITKLVIMRIINRLLSAIYELPFNNREINTNTKHTFKNSCIKENSSCDFHDSITFVPVRNSYLLLYLFLYFDE